MKNLKKPTRKEILIDTNIIAMLAINNTDSIIKELDSLSGHVLTSQMTVIELFYNSKAKSIRKIEELLEKITIIPLSKELGDLGFSLTKAYPLKLHAADAIIAATARLYNLSLYTNNRKDFANIAGVHLYRPQFHAFPLKP